MINFIYINFNYSIVYYEQMHLMIMSSQLSDDYDFPIYHWSREYRIQEKGGRN